MKLEVGKTYVTANGCRVKIVYAMKNKFLGVLSVLNEEYAAEWDRAGRLLPPSPFDQDYYSIVKELPPLPELPEELFFPIWPSGSGKHQDTIEKARRAFTSTLAGTYAFPLGVAIYKLVRTEIF